MKTFVWIFTIFTHKKYVCKNDVIESRCHMSIYEWIVCIPQVFSNLLLNSQASIHFDRRRFARF